MTDKPSALEAIDSFLNALRSELRHNPELTYRLLASLPTEIHFDAAEASTFLSPIEIVAGKSYPDSCAALEAFTSKQLRQMAVDANLAASSDLKSLRKDELLDLIIRRSQSKISERSS